MCSTTALAVTTLAASGVSAYNQYKSGQYQADVANQNAKLADAQANDAINRGNADAEQKRREMRQRQGQQAAALGATGGEMSSGSSLDIFGDTTQYGTLDALTTVNNAQREAYGYQVQAANSRAQADAAEQQGTVGAFSTLLTAPLKAYGVYNSGGGSWNPFTQSKAAPLSAAKGTRLPGGL
ncbi:hypothetical protein ABKE32_000495 [Escherichia albertii]|uniref:hypothetical protein n=1 Tax=Escherichia albertii TaxID=208962 RepID=UPI0007434F99|nr:hypothetical protein [Escherichia albertii]